MTPEQLEKLGLAEGASEEEINAKLDELLATQNSDTSSGGGEGDGGEDDTDNGLEGRGWPPPSRPAATGPGEPPTDPHCRVVLPDEPLPELPGACPPCSSASSCDR